jgi:hypothetical protein
MDLLEQLTQAAAVVVALVHKLVDLVGLEL